MLALELLRAITNWNDLGFGTFSLHFVKNKDKQEVDFLLARDNEPILLIEAKLNETMPSPALRKFQTDLDVPAVQLTVDGEGFRLFSNGLQKILISPAWPGWRGCHDGMDDYPEK